MTRDLRKYGSQTNIRLAIGGVVLLFVVGDGLIYLIYGKGPALMGLLCLLAGMVPVVLILLLLALLNWITKRAKRE
jgi:hypothetical protein